MSCCLGLGELVSYGVDGACMFTRSCRTTDTASCRAGRSRRGLARGALIHCGFANDADGHKLCAQVTEAYPRAEAIVRERPLVRAKDWNDALQAERGRQTTPDRAPGPEQSRGRDSRADERR